MLAYHVARPPSTQQHELGHTSMAQAGTCTAGTSAAAPDWLSGHSSGGRLTMLYSCVRGSAQPGTRQTGPRLSAGEACCQRSAAPSCTGGSMHPCACSAGGGGGMACGCCPAVGTDCGAAPPSADSSAMQPLPAGGRGRPNERGVSRAVHRGSRCRGRGDGGGGLVER